MSQKSIIDHFIIQGNTIPILITFVIVGKGKKDGENLDVET